MTQTAPLARDTLTFRRIPNEHPASPERRAEILENPGFGTHFTDHMVVIEWEKGRGWHDARVEPYGPLAINPGSAVLHYGQEVFEGLKAYRHPNGEIFTFRPDRNAARFNRSARRLALPELPPETFIESLRQVVQADADWVPAAGSGKTLYLRPFAIAFEDFLGVRPAHTVRYFVIASPAGSYFADPTTPVSIWLSEKWERAGKGGTGFAKTAGNYAASLLPQEEAYEQGCEQVLFLDSVDHEHIEELGGMNLVLVYRDGTLVTPKSDSILEGVTRTSILELAAEAGHKVEERPVTITEWREGAASGEIVEAFACGTAAVISPIGTLKAPGFEIDNPAVTPDSLSMRLRKALTDLQNGLAPDPHGWLERLA